LNRQIGHSVLFVLRLEIPIEIADITFLILSIFTIMGSSSLWFETVFPLLGSAIGFLLLSSPLRVLPGIIKTGDLKSFNPVPSAVMIVSGVSGSIYGMLHPAPTSYMIF